MASDGFAALSSSRDVRSFLKPVSQGLILTCFDTCGSYPEQNSLPAVPVAEKQWASSVHLDGERRWGPQRAIFVLEDWASGDPRVSAHGPVGPALLFFLADGVGMAEGPSRGA